MAEIRIPVGGGPGIKGPTSYTVKLPEIVGVSDKQAAFGESKRRQAISSAAALVVGRTGFLAQPQSTRRAFINALEKEGAKNTSAKHWIESAPSPRDLAIAATRVAQAYQNKLEARRASLSEVWSRPATAPTIQASGGGMAARAGNGASSAG